MIKKMLKSIRQALLVFLTHHIALPVLRSTRKKKQFPYSAVSLRQMPADTAGYGLIQMLDQKGLALLPYYEKHDIKHLLLGYDMDEEGEACLQSFMLGNGRFSFPVLATVVFAWLTMPEYHSSMRQAFREGKRRPALAQCDWFALLPMPLPAARSFVLGHQSAHDPFTYKTNTNENDSTLPGS